MKTSPSFASLLFEKASLTRITPPGEAGLLICSLPLPREKVPCLSLAGAPTWRRDLGQWPGEAEGVPRRALLAAAHAGAAPDRLALSASAATAPVTAPPSAELVLVEQSPEPEFFWERHAVRIRWQDRTVDFMMGMKVKDEIHWWEACNLVTRDESPLCRVVEAGGAIPHVLTTLDDLRNFTDYANPFLHRHNWLNGHLGLRLHANGVCEVFAHHINSKVFDDGLPLADAVPVVGIRTPDSKIETYAAALPWDGTRESLEVGAVRFDLAEAARLATPEKPGSLSADARVGFLVWQPYLGMELFGGVCARDRLSDTYVFRAEQQIIPRGMGRTLRFSFSLNASASPKVARYLAPSWWYGLCEELTPASLLPVFNRYDVELDATAESAVRVQFKHGFEDGSVPRHGTPEDMEKFEPGWEGEVGYAMFLLAWRRGLGDLYQGALRAAYHFADVVVDHAAFRVRMHGYPPHAFSVPMERIHVMVAGFLETGDDYLLSTAMSVIDTAHWTHKNSWPRMCVGRDACYIRGQMMLYRYFADAHYLKLARDAAQDVVDSQRPDGSFGDQGGGAGIHGWGAYITKPWMGLMAVGGLIDYLELADSEDGPVFETVKKFADWLMRERYDHKGVMGWGYQHYYNNTRFCYHLLSGKSVELPGEMLWHVNYLARILTFCALRYNRADYFAAWAESQEASMETLMNRPRKPLMGDHRTAQNGQYLPWTQMRLWNARLDGKGAVVCQPVYAGERTPAEGVIETPDGPVKLAWNGSSSVAADGGKAAIESLRKLG
jgi:hypothetical protein